jgi:hypothetical protein
MRLGERLLLAVVAAGGPSLGGCVVHAYTGTPPPDNAPAATPAPQAAAQHEKIQHVTGANYVIHSSQNQSLCVDAKGDKPADRTTLELYGCHGKENQRWAFEDRAQNASSIVGIGNLCIDVTEAKTADGSPTELFKCGAQKNQGWRHFEDGRIRELQTGKCLTASGEAQGAAIVISHCDPNNPSQVWTLTQ